MSRTLFQVVVICVATLCSSVALAKVEVEAGQNKSLGRVLVAKVSEDIAQGDYEALLNGIKANPGVYAKKIVLLDTIGGGVAEAIKMGRLLRETGFDTMVPSTGVCQGSCIYLLAAGGTKTVRGYVGIHRPYFPSGDSAHAAPSLAMAGTSPALYFKEMNIPLSLLEAMQSTPPQKMRVLKPAELARYRLN